MSNFEEKKPHAVLTPFPVQGHINALLKLGKLLHLRGFHITFVNTEYNHNRLLKSRGPNAFDGFTDFTFETIPDGLTPKDGDGDVSQDIRALCLSIMKNFHHFFDEFLAKLNDCATAGLIPPVTCLVSDCNMAFTVDAAEKHALPIVLFSPCSASYFYSTFHIIKLFQNGVLPLKDESYLTDGNLDTRVDWIPGLKNISLKDFPDIIRIKDPDVIKHKSEETNKCQRASVIIFNTSNELESDAMNALSSMFPSLY